MRKIWLLSLTALLAMVSCNGQNKNNTNSESKNDANSPITEIKVNKEYDEEGNLVRFDSTYSSYYSNIKTDDFARDSIFDNFRKQFHSLYPFSSKPFFDELFFEDSLLQYDFYRHDFFSERFRQNTRRMDRLFMEMDSVKNQFFWNQFPEDKSNKQQNN